MAQRPSGKAVIRNKLTSDPAASLEGNTVYLDTGHDEAPKREQRYGMNQWRGCSSTDRVNRNEQSVPLRVTDFAWTNADGAICRMAMTSKRGAAAKQKMCRPKPPVNLKNN